MPMRLARVVLVSPGRGMAMGGSRRMPISPGRHVPMRLARVVLVSPGRGVAMGPSRRVLI
jgi:hypothetical protein